MNREFETRRFELVDTDLVRIPGYGFGHNETGDFTVRIETTDKGKRFLSQIAVKGEERSVRKGVYTGECYILREKATGRYWFLDMNSHGFWLQNDTFSGAQTFYGPESSKIQEWLAHTSKSTATL